MIMDRSVPCMSLNIGSVSIMKPSADPPITHFLPIMSDSNPNKGNVKAATINVAVVDHVA